MRMIAVKDLLFSRAWDREKVEHLLEVLRWYKKYISGGGMFSDITDVIKVYESIATVEDIKNPIILRRVDGEYELLRGSWRIATAIAKGFKHLPGLIDGKDSAELVQKYREA